MGTTTLDKAGCGCEGADGTSGEAILPADPFTTLQYHFGMLLGVDDLETAQSYPRGKVRLHNAWLHREGVVWGFDVSINERRELAVAPGLALDAAGHELHLDAIACVDLGKWYHKHKGDTTFTFTTDTAGSVTFDAHVVARFRACGARPVPAIADPCEGADSDIAFSRVSETVELLLRPGKAPLKDRGYHRLRILFSIEDDATALADAKYDEVRTRRQAILALSSDQQPLAYLKAFREFAALDEIDLHPQADADGTRTSLFPEDPTEVVLADVTGIDVRPGTAASTLVDLPVIDVRVRPSHVATATIQELLCGPLFALVAAAAGPVAGPAAGPGVPAGGPPGTPAAAPPVDAGGPRIDAASVKRATTKRITLTATPPLDKESVVPDQFSVMTYTAADGWDTIDIKAVQSSTTATTTTITVDLKEAMPAGQLVRLVVRGTGPCPILGVNLVPLAGAVGGAPGSKNDGNDFAIMLT